MPRRVERSDRPFDRALARAFGHVRLPRRAVQNAFATGAELTPGPPKARTGFILIHPSISYAHAWRCGLLCAGITPLEPATVFGAPTYHQSGIAVFNPAVN